MSRSMVERHHSGSGGTKWVELRDQLWRLTAGPDLRTVAPQRTKGRIVEFHPLEIVAPDGGARGSAGGQ